MLSHGGEPDKVFTGTGYCSPAEFPWDKAYAWTECDGYYATGYFNVKAAWPEGWMTRDLFPKYYYNPSYDWVAVGTSQMIGAEPKSMRESVIWTICEFQDANKRLKKAGIL